jgi:16S rRNA (cytosine967-C5)-methyltransferase
MRESPPQRSTSPGQSLPLWQLLQHTAQAVAEVQQGRSLTEALSACPGSARPGTQALSFAVMRQLGMARKLRGLLVSRQPAPWVDGLLITALALALGEQYTTHTLVDQAVDACKRKAKPASGMVNAVLRRFLREREALLAEATKDPVARFNHPRWWIDRLKADWPEHWQALLESNQQAAPMMLRVNRRHGTVIDYQARLREQGASSQAFGDAGLLLDQALPVQALPGFDAGDVSVQDASAQQATHWLLHAHEADGTALSALPSGARVLDACSAPGGKTAHLLEAADLKVLALDTDAGRLVRVTETLQRLGLQAETRAVDAADTAAWWGGQPFDAIMLDAPCSASGIVRRHPDVRWLRRATDIDALADIQARLLDTLWPLLKPGGRLLYCTCSVFKAEGQACVEAFLQRQPQARRGQAPGHLLPVVEYPENVPLVGDGFFHALLLKAL